MVIQIRDDFDPDRIADSGQCFRWEKTGNTQYRILAGSSCLYLEKEGEDAWSLSCGEEEYASFWRDYLDLGEDYRAIRRRIDPDLDPFLYRASEEEKGIRILRQDPWEMLVTFIISQNRNIPAIKRSVELLSERCGDKRTDLRGETYYGFPSPEALAGLSGQDLTDCRLGYRCRYVHEAALAVLEGRIDLEGLKEADEEETMAALTGLLGVGIKVASCVSLFGLHHTDAFPIDVWVRRILEREYPAGYPYERYSPYNGIFQQYMFAWYRHHYEEIRGEEKRDAGKGRSGKGQSGNPDRKGGANG